MDYLESRKSLKEISERVSSDYEYRENFTDREKQLNRLIKAQKEHEIEIFMAENGGFHPAQKDIDFLRAHVLDVADKSSLWTLIKAMPKGSILHAHFDSIVDCRWLIKNGTYDKDCYFQPPSTTGGLLFKYSKTLPYSHSEEPAWLNVTETRNNCRNGPDAFDEELFHKMTLIPMIRADKNVSDAGVWSKFLDTFISVEGLISYEPLFKKYCWKKFEQLLEDGVFYLEERLVNNSILLYDGSGIQYPIEKTISTFLSIVNNFKKVHPKFIGAKIIFCGLKMNDESIVRNSLEKCIALKRLYPDAIAAFDLVGYEDVGYTLLHYISHIQWFVEECKKHDISIPFVWHAGETVDAGGNADENLYDAILLHSKRIGHGLSLEKHYYLKELVKEKDIAIELCPISNRVLNYATRDTRLHPFLNFLNSGMPLVLSPDDPAIFGINENPSSYDFWISLISWNTVDLATLKMLVWNSVRYSLISTEEKNGLLQIVKEDWQVWVESSINVLESIRKIKL